MGQMETLGKLETNTTNVIMEIERLSHLRNNEVQPHKYGSLHFLLLLVQLTLGYLALVNYLKACSPVMYCVFTSFKERQTLGLAITQEDIQIASGKQVLDPGQTKVYFKNLELTYENLRLAFEKQAENAAVPLFL